MKLYKYISMLLLASVASCTIERLPISELSEDAYFNDADAVATGLVACYAGLQEPMKYEWQLTEMRSDNTRVELLTSTSTATLRNIEFDKCAVTTTNESVYDYWVGTYKNISNCNTVLDAMGVVDDEDEANELEGQARFIRAYHYFNLVRLFGPVFIIDTRISAQEALEYSRSPVSDVYEFIINDLELAADMLEDVVYDSGNEARVTTWSAKALLGKVYMTLQDYSTASSYLSDVITNSGHELEATYEDVFSISNECNNEILFTIRYTSGGLGLGSPFGNWFAPQQSGDLVIANDGSSYNYPTSIIIAAHTVAEEDTAAGTDAVYDLRKDTSVKEGYFKDESTWIDDAYVNKFISPVTNDEDGDKDWPIIRYADVILLYAEALNELNGPSAAIPYINMTRARGGLDNLDASDYTTKYSMRMALEDERQVEFAFENQRWFDLVRTDRACEVINQGFIDDLFYAESAEDGDDMNIQTVTENALLLPIPQEEIDANPNITQNAGY
ncbi:MAG: RagB/SusD family nutrient uptake outer membrane protein [Rikenellaceae bacterium]